MNLKSVAAFGALGVGVYFATKALDASNLADKLKVRIFNPRIFKFDVSSLSLVVLLDIILDNPTRGSVTILSPVVSISENGREIANSTPSGKQTKIEPNNRTTIKDYSINIPLTALLSQSITVLGSIIAALSNGSKLFSQRLKDLKLNKKLDITAIVSLPSGLQTTTKESITL